MVGHRFFATTPRGMEPLLVAELNQFGASDIARGSAGVAFSGELVIAYKTCLWSRVTNRVLLSVGEFPADNEKELYGAVRSLNWSQHMAVSSTLAVNAHSAKSAITHTQFAAQRVKDAVVDQFRAIDGSRPSVDREQPDIRINAYLFRNRLRLSLDLSGGSLHRRFYRQSDSGAPLKENLAAAILQFSGWPEIAAQGGSFIDPMCGSGTLLIEAAMMAADIAPGLHRGHYGFTAWKQHQPKIWSELLDEAKARREQGLQSLPVIRGFDLDRRAVTSARENIVAAGLQDHIDVTKSDIAALAVDADLPAGLLLTNPPYGQRLDAEGGLAPLYSTLGKLMRRNTHWKAAVFTGNPSLAHRFKLPSSKTISLSNGDIDCKLLIYAATSAKVSGSQATAVNDNSGVEMFANRMAKNLKSIGGWAKGAGVQCYRVYDADLPEYAVAIDLYPGQDGIKRVHVQEYAAPKTVDPARAEQRLQQLVDALPNLLDCDPRQIYLKVRTRQRGDEQYEKIARREEFHAVAESNCRLLVNLADYHDCGLFLDHRKVRQRIQKSVGGKRFLNLFAYTGAASVHAAAGGARHITTVDMSSTYLDWAKRNFILNEFDGSQHEIVRADCLEWLSATPSREKYDVILLDPPTFSNSKRMSTTWDVQRDHADTISKTMAHLEDTGFLLFSTNRQRFKLDRAVEEAFSCKEISKQTVPRDFARNPRIHRCWEIRFLNDRNAL